MRMSYYKSVYLCGPMRGYPKYNFPAFDQVAHKWRMAEHYVISPAEMDRKEGFDENADNSNFFMPNAVLRDIEAIIRCQAVVVLPGWQRSKGASAEVAVAKWLEKPILDSETGNEIEVLPASIVFGPGPKQSPKVDSIPNGNFSIHDSGTRRSFSTGAQRDTGHAKGMPHLIPYEPFERLALLYENGAKKYGKDNWRKGIPLSVFLDSAIRHLLKLSNEMKDEDHAAAVIWNLFGYIWTEAQIKDGKLPQELSDLRE